MEETCMRADVALVARGLAQSRERAQGLIRSGLVQLDGQTLTKSSVKVSENALLTVLGREHPYVSRGGLKLEKALRAFDVSAEGLVCLDIGASTGGFTDVLLQNGAKMVYAVDVGTGQLAPSLLSDPRVVSMERVNARELHREMFAETPALAVMDVSFISATLILPAAFSVLGERGRMLSLIKPQFEAGPKALGKNGVVSDPKIHEAVLRRIADFVPTLGWHVRALDFSPIAGTSGNLEFLADFAPGASPSPISSEAIHALVQTAHRSLKM